MSAVPWWAPPVAVAVLLLAQHVRTVANRNRRRADAEYGSEQ